jgi:HSP20 family protein
VLGDAFVPLADVEETAEAYVVEIELPGVKKPDLDIEIAGRRLVVAGERKERQRRGILRRRERTVGRFHYEVTFPGDVDESNIEANLDEGVLTVRAPKPERDRPRRIEVR